MSWDGWQDKGIEVHFANEALDLHSRGGRLSADIQAVVAADYIRNLREETKKGFYGRLKQGLFPMPAPIGYLDKGQGKPKEPDPIKAPIVKMAFELYATGRFNLRQLNDETYRSGLRTRSGKRLCISALSGILNNPFYIGLIRLKKSGELFPGIHTPLVKKTLFDRVQEVLEGKVAQRSNAHDFPYRRMISCELCGFSLIGECQKGHTYYRCHSETCRKTSIKEETVEENVLAFLRPLEFDNEERGFFQRKILSLEAHCFEEQEKYSKALRLQLGRLDEQLNRVTDAYVDRLIEKESFEDRKGKIVTQRVGLEQQLAAVEGGSMSVVREVAKILELAGSAYSLYKEGIVEEKRELLIYVTSNRVVARKTLCLSYQQPYASLADRVKVESGAPRRVRARTLTALWNKLAEFVMTKDYDATFSERSKRTV